MKFKSLSKDYIKICIDRLTRFKPVCEKYSRVFNDIINKHLIDNKNVSKMPYDQKAKIAVEIFNSSFENLSDFKLNKIIKEDEEKIYNLTSEEKFYLNLNLDFESALSLFSENELPLNLKRLKLQKNNKSDEVRKKFSTLYPVSKVVLTEGITEEILLSEFAKILGTDFEKEGIYVLGAGGKNQVAKKYYQLAEEIKIPIFVLLDNDAGETENIILKKIRDIDDIYKIKTGEFEDILPENLIKNALNCHFSQNLQTKENIIGCGRTVFELQNCYKNNGWGEFKKSDFAKIIREYLHESKNPPVSDELKEIAKKIERL